MAPMLDSVRSSIQLYRLSTSAVRLIPDFIIIGVQRGGTTSLYAYLSNHLSILPASMKEVHFFDKNFQHGLPWYRAQFPSILHKRLIEQLRGVRISTGEASPYYLFHPHVPKRIAALTPYAKFIVLLRNPVSRAYSQYYHEVEMGHEQLSFEEALEQEEARTKHETERLIQDEYYYSYNHQHYTYLARGLYAEQLEAWFQYFPREQFLILKSEDFYTAPVIVLEQVAAFLNIPTTGFQQTEYKALNSSSYKQSEMDEATKKQLIDYYQPHNKRLYQLIKRDFGWNAK